jgi:hypothetical protein
MLTFYVCGLPLRASIFDCGKKVDMQRIYRLTLWMTALVGFSDPIGYAWVEASDTIYFKDGMRTVCEGNAWEKGDEVHCEYDGGLLIYRKSDVAQIEKGRLVEPELDPKNAPEIEPPPAQEPAPAPPPSAGAASSTPPADSSGIAFYDPRRPQKYWSSESRHHATFRDAISALAEEFNRPEAWIEENLGNSNELSEIRRTLASRLSQSAAANAAPDSAFTAMEFYNPRRTEKYMTGPEAKHDSFLDAVDALAREFDKPADWVERHMGESNDVGEIRQNLKNALEGETDR